jgi:hypothetical protein
MKRDEFNHRQDGLHTIGGTEMYDFVQERYHNLLREAEQYRLERRVSRPRPSASSQVVSQPLAHLLSWAKVRWATLTHAA